MSAVSVPRPQVPTGIPGFDVLLHGGLPAHRLYLVEGHPGVGKTTFALQFLLEGVRRGEKALYITLSETMDELQAVADSHGWSLDGLAVFDLASTQESLTEEWQQTLFHPAEVELGHAIRTLLEEVERVGPSRVVFDSLSELRLLAQSPLRYRRQLLALKQHFAGRRSTVLLLDDRTAGPGDMQLMSLAHGVVTLEQLSPEYGPDRRRLRIVKMRGLKFGGGFHDYNIRKGGLEVFPRMISSEHSRAAFPAGRLSSGIVELDDLVGGGSANGEGEMEKGGLDRGTSTLIIGPSGVGKTTVALQFASAAAGRGERVAVFNFEEGPETMLSRGDRLGMDLTAAVEGGLLTLTHVNPTELSPGEFSAMLREAVEQRGVSMVLIDTLNGYLSAMPEERALPMQLRELLSYLNGQGVATLLVVGQQGMVGATMSTTVPVDVSYIADSVILLRYFEFGGAIHQAISMMKKRSGLHERQIRELVLARDGIKVGPPLENFHGILTGVPQYEGSRQTLMREQDGK